MGCLDPQHTIWCHLDWGVAQFLQGLNVSKDALSVTVNFFASYSLKDKAKFILEATYQHGRNLALLTAVYKIVTLLFRKLTGKDHPVFTFIAAFTGGYLVFGENNKVNMQVNQIMMTPPPPPPPSPPPSLSS